MKLILKKSIELLYENKEEYLIALGIAKKFIYRNYEYNKFKKEEMIKNNIKEIVSTAKHSKNENRFYFLKGSINTILELIKKQNIEIEIIDERIEGKEINFQTDLIPRDEEQKKSVDSFINLEYKAGVLIATCGFGKSFSAILIMKEINRKTLILIDETLILKQWIKYLEKHSHSIKIGVIKGGKIKQETLDCDVIIASKGTLINRPEELRMLSETIGFVIVDECHTAAADIFNTVIAELNPKYLLGLTATPKRADRKEYIIKDSIGKSFFEADRKILIEKGSVVLPKLFLMFVMDNFKSYKLYRNLVANLEKNKNILTKFAAFVKKIYDSNNNYQLCILKKIELCEKVKDELVKLGVNKEEILILNSLTEEREQELENADNGKYKIILTAKLLDKAISINRLNILHNFYPTREFSNMQQRAGRISRSFEGKEFAYVFDYVFNHDTFVDQFKTEKKDHWGEKRDDRFSAYELCTDTYNSLDVLNEIKKYRSGIIGISEFKHKKHLL